MSDIEYRPVPSFPRYQAGSDGTVVGPAGKALKGCVIPDGYIQVLIYPGDGPRLTRRVHTLICEAFHGPKPSPKHQVAHWDGNPSNNTPGNLRWATCAENIGDKVRHGRVSRTSGEIDGQSKLTQQQVMEIRARWRESQRALAVEYGISQPTISNIITRKTWRHC